MEPVITHAIGPITTVDTGMAGERELNAVYLIAGPEPCLVETGPGADGPAVRAALDEMGVGAGDLAHILVTHIHVDHAGGAGALLETFPRATLWVHERGAPHLVDPTRLVASTARTYGEERMRRLYGETLPCPPDRIRAVADADEIPLGDGSLRVVHAPGHASHHVALLHDPTGAMFTGEAIGTFLPWGPAYRPALPPPEVDVEAAAGTLARIEAAGPSTLLTSHFGPVPDVDEALERARRGLRDWSGTVERILRAEPATNDDTLDDALRELAATAFAEEAGRPLGEDAARYDALGSIRMNAQGLGRYWRKRLEAEASASQAS